MAKNPSKRICDSDRRTIAKNMVASRFDVQTKVIKQELTALAKVIYDELFPPAVQTIMAQLPAGFLPTTQEINIWDSRRKKITLDLQASYPASADIAMYRNYAVVSDDMMKKVEEVLRRELNLRDERQAAFDSAFRLLTSFNTVKRLLEGWPEVRPFLPAYLLNDENKSLPAPQVAAVNALFGLPIDTPETDEAKEAA